MGLHNQRRSHPVRRRFGLAGALLAPVLLLSACSAEDKYQLTHWAMPDADATEQSIHIYQLWKWSWIALLIVGVLTWFLMFYAAWRYRRRHDDDVPVQLRYHLPLEILYTIAPLIMVIVLFDHTVQAQNKILHMDENPDRVIHVVGQQWSWTFNYEDGDQYAYEYGTGSEIPTLYLPVGETTEFKLTSPDVIHSFWITGFLMKMDIIPGKENSFQVTPRKEGSYDGKCAELCGVYHSRMLFNVEVVSPEEYEQHLQDLEDAGQVGDEPVIGAGEVDKQPGLDTGDDEGEH